MNRGETESCELTPSSSTDRDNKDDSSYNDDSLNNQVTERKQKPLITQKVDNKLASRNINQVRPTSPIRITIFQKSTASVSINKVQPKQGHNFT